MGAAETMGSGRSRGPAEVVTVSRTYSASVEAAFDAWTIPARLEKWFGPPGFRARVLTHEPYPGGQWRFVMEGDGGERFHHSGTFLEVARPTRLVFTWASEEHVEALRDEKGEPTRVTVTFEPAASGAGVTVTIIHEGLVSDCARDALTFGWDGSLACLGEIFETMEDVR